MSACHLPLDVARCQPTGCRQSERCARATDWPTGDDIELPVIDASVCLTTEAGSWCPIFIDRRGLALLEQDMTITRATRTRVLDAIPIGGAPLRLISQTSGVHISNVRTVAGHLVDEGKVFATRAGTGQGGKHELWLFWTEPARDCFLAEWAEKVAAKERDRNAARTAQRRQDRTVNPARSIAAERREAERARIKAESEAAKSAERAQLVAAQAKLREKTKRAGTLTQPRPAVAPTVTLPKASAWDVAAPAVLPPGVKVTRLPSPPPRFHVDVVVGGFSSLPPGVYALPPNSCAAKATQGSPS